MIGGLPYKTKQFFFLLIKLSIVFGAFYFIYNKLTTNEELKFSDFAHFLSKNALFSPKSVIFVLFLTIFNWFFEILKWQNLVSYVKKISFLDAMKQSLGALTASLFTPNRIGEYGAKVVYYSKQFRKHVLLLNLIGNMAQMTITTVLGLVGLWFFVSEYEINISHYKLSRLLLLIFLIVAFSIFALRQKRFRIKGFSIERIKSHFLKMPKNLHIRNILYSIFRYAIFSFQFYYLLSIFGVKYSYLDVMALITTMYFLASIIPSIFIFDVVIKGSVAVYLFSFIDVDELTILSVITIMWILNFVLPSIFGSYYILNFNWNKLEEQ